MGLSARKLGKLSGAKKIAFNNPQLNEEARRYRTCVGGRTPHPQGGVLIVEMAYGSQPKSSRRSPPIADSLAVSGKSAGSKDCVVGLVGFEVRTRYERTGCLE